MTLGVAPAAGTRAVSALRVDALEAGYERTTVLRGVSVDVPVGEVTALLGPNGAGKSTLLRVMAGLLKPQHGRVELFGSDITNMPTYRRAVEGLCYIPEGRGVYKSLSVRENILMQTPKRDERVALERLDSVFPVLTQRLGQLAETLSGGEQQMLAMARAYIQHQRVICVDEASLGLAPLVVDQIFDFLENHLVRESGVSLLVVDQFVQRTLGIATTAYVLRQGEIVFGGAAADLREQDVFEHYLQSGAS